MSGWKPTVSVIIPARDAADSLPAALGSIRDQTYDNIIDVVVAAADAPTAHAAASATVVDNPAGSTPAGLNRAIAAVSGEVVVRCDAHAVLPSGYVARAVETMSRTGADNVGGMQVPVGQRPLEVVIAAAMSSPLGAGDARYRIGGPEGPVETVYLGVFKKSVLDRLGGFDESFLRTQDFELNHRIVESGGLVYFDPELKVEYRPRGSLVALASQYYQYGRAKRQLTRRYPSSLRARQVAPPVAVLGVVGAGLAALVWTPLITVPLTYLAILLVGGLMSPRAKGLQRLAVPLPLAIMHFAWGIGFLVG